MSTDSGGTVAETEATEVGRRRAIQLSVALGTSVCGGVGLTGSAAAQSASTTWIRASLRGQTAEDVAFGGDTDSVVETQVAGELPELLSTDVIVRHDPQADRRTVEIVGDAVSSDQFAAALDASGYAYDGITDELTQQTRDETIAVIERRLYALGVAEYTVQQGRDETGFVIVIRIPDEQRQAVLDLLGMRSTVQLDIYHQSNGEYVTEKRVLTADDL